MPDEGQIHTSATEAKTAAEAKAQAKASIAAIAAGKQGLSTSKRQNKALVRTNTLANRALFTFRRLFGVLAAFTIARAGIRGFGQLIKLEDPEFERLFVVYGDDQIQARYILSTSLMERIMQFKAKSQRPIYLSFVGSKVFVAVSYTKNLFEPKIFSTLLDFGPIRQYYEDLQLAVGIVEDLNLNTRIWSRQ